MSRDKQIEVKANAKDIKGLADLLVDFGRTYDDSIQGLEDLLIEAIITAGYRKADEVALEAIGKIEKIIDKHYNKHIFGSNDLEDVEKDAIINFSDDVTYDIFQLKKKYTESEKDK